MTQYPPSVSPGENLKSIAPTDNLANVSTMSTSYFTEDTFINEQNTRDKEILPEYSNLPIVAFLGIVVWDHAEHAVQLPQRKEENN